MVIPKRNFSNDDGLAMIPYFVPDNAGPFALRYLWVKHRFDNDKFVNNYFSADAVTGINIRKQTTHLKNSWDLHNLIFELSKNNGDLVWRFKVHNPVSQSIDYIEVWKSADVLNNYFRDRLCNDTTIGDNVWKFTDRLQFAESLWDAGFDLRSWEPWQLISGPQSREIYEMLFNKWKNRDSCILNTDWNTDINPV